MTDVTTREALLSDDQRRELVSKLFQRSIEADHRRMTPDFVGRLAVMGDDELLCTWHQFEAEGCDDAIELLARHGLSSMSVQLVTPVSCEGGEPGPRVVAIRISAPTILQYMDDYGAVMDMHGFGSLSIDLDGEYEFGPDDARVEPIHSASAVIRKAQDGEGEVSFVFVESRPGELDRDIATAPIALARLNSLVKRAILDRHERVYEACNAGEADTLLATNYLVAQAAQPRARGDRA